MITGHVSSDELELYVIDALDGQHAEEVEGHVMACKRCSAAMAREARLETVLAQVAQRGGTALRACPSPADGVTLVRRAHEKLAPAVRVLFATVALSAAAAAMLWMTPGSGAGATWSAPSSPRARGRAIAGDATTASLDARLRDELDGG